jgi:hypothetical protein
MNPITTRHATVDKTTPRRKMIVFMSKSKHKKIYRDRAYKAGTMQGLVKDIFEIDLCCMRDDANNRWLFAAMYPAAIQMHQFQAFKQGRKFWNIKEQVLG